MSGRKEGARRSRRGALLVEVVLAAALLALVSGSAVLLTNVMRRSYRTEFTVNLVTENVDTAMSEMVSRLREADLDAVFPAAAPGAFSDWIDFERVVLPGFPAATPESFVLEADPNDPDDGVDNDGDGRIDERFLVWYENRGLVGEKRRILSKSVAEDLAGEIPGNLLDDNGNGVADEKGLCFEFQEGRIVVHLTIEKVDAFGSLVRRTIERTVALRNTGVGAL